MAHPNRGEGVTNGTCRRTCRPE